jgi:hypothetical protein
MKKIFGKIFCIMLLFEICSSCSNESSKSPNSNIENSFIGRLIDLPSIYPHCGVFKYLVGFKFRDAEHRKDIVLLLPCPELMGNDFFVKNSKYEARLRTNSKNSKDYLIVNNFLNDSLEILVASTIVKVEETQ